MTCMLFKSLIVNFFITELVNFLSNFGFAIAQFGYCRFQIRIRPRNSTLQSDMTHSEHTVCSRIDA